MVRLVVPVETFDEKSLLFVASSVVLGMDSETLV
jgi:hypothetical protein